MGSPSALRRLNDRAALYALLESGPLSRSDLERAVGVSRPAAAELLRRLEESGLARRAGHRGGGPGPQAQLWTISERAAFAAGLDVNESGIDCVIADLGGTPLADGRIVLDDSDDPAVAVRRLLSATARRAGVRRSDLRQIVVGISGSVDPETGELSHADHIPEWNGFDVRARLTRELGTQVTVENDVKLVLSDESIRGRAVGASEVLLLWIGQGVATAVIADGRLVRGSQGTSGEMGLVPLTPDGPLAGEILSLAGLRALAREHGLSASDPVRTVARAAAGAGGDHDALLDSLAARIVELLASPIALLDPQLVILAGDIGVAGGDELAERVRTGLEGLLVHRPRVVPGTGYDNSVRQGALDEALRRLRATVFADTRENRAALSISASVQPSPTAEFTSTIRREALP